MDKIDNNEVQNKLKALQESLYKIKVKVLDDGKLPVKAHRTDAGFDLFATSDIVIYPGQVIKHPLNIQMQLPEGTWAEITSKSGLGAKGLLVYAGVIDESYRGIPHVVATNVLHVTSAGTKNLEPLVIKKGEKLAQLIMNPYSSLFEMEEVSHIDTNTDRGVGGFGSSGR